MRRALPLVIVLLIGVVLLNIFLLANTPSNFPPARGEAPPPRPVDEIPEENMDDYLLPDMQVAPPKSIYIQSLGETKKIRFDTTFSNIGDGPLEMIGSSDEESGITVANQVLHKKDGTTEERQIGEFVYHPGHRHWHVDRYGLFQLYNYSRERGPGELVASTDKFSFCIWDEHTYDLTLPGAPQSRVFLRCVNTTQGNSVGWGDTYTPNLEGQELDITGVPDGEYMVRSKVNADEAIIEKSYLNNEAILYIRITGNNLEVINY